MQEICRRYRITIEASRPNGRLAVSERGRSLKPCFGEYRKSRLPIRRSSNTHQSRTPFLDTEYFTRFTTR